MGTTADALSVPIVGSMFFSVTAFLVAFFHQTAARVLSGSAFGFAVLFLIGILEGAHGHYWWLLHVLRGASPVIFFLYGSLFLSAVAAWAPLRRPGGVQTNSERLPATTRWRLFSAAVTIVMLGIILAMIPLFRGNIGEENARQLLSGDLNVRIERIEVDGQQRRVICTDPEVLRYLEDQFRRHEPGHNFTGWSYDLTLTFHGGGRQSFYTYWSDSGDFDFFIGEPGEGGTGHDIRLGKPRPQGVDRLVEFLRKPYEEIANSTLILEPGKSRIDRDPSLVAH